LKTGGSHILVPMNRTGVLGQASPGNEPKCRRKREEKNFVARRAWRGRGAADKGLSNAGGWQDSKPRGAVPRFLRQERLMTTLSVGRKSKKKE